MGQLYIVSDSLYSAPAGEVIDGRAPTLLASAILRLHQVPQRRGLFEVSRLQESD
jgi:hypothetical protein